MVELCLRAGMFEPLWRNGGMSPSLRWVGWEMWLVSVGELAGGLVVLSEVLCTREEKGG